MTVELVLLSRVAYRGREITGTGLRELLALLAGDLRSGCSTARLIDGLWPEQQPEHPAKALQTLVSRVRAMLGPDVLVSTPAGYRLALGAEQVDAGAVPILLSTSERAALAGDHASALRAAEAGLALCDGVTDDPPGGPLSALRAEIGPARIALIRVRALALSRLARPAEAIKPLTELAGQHPRDEEVLAELLRCTAALAGPAAALTRYAIYRQQLRDELGSDPGPALRAVHRELLLSDAPAVRHGVRQEPNQMLGRDRDVAAVTALLGTSRVTSIVGPGGLGKTRLAHAVARDAPQRVVHFVGLAGVTTGDVTGEVASALGVREAPGRAAQRSGPLAGILDALGPGPALLVLDNCEHVIDAAAELVRSLVSAGPELRVLTTGRAPLRLWSESVYPLPALDPATTAELFGRRARAIRPDVELPEAVVRKLCDRLDGLPLAVELAAARMSMMSVDEVARRLDDRFDLLRAHTRDSPPRHRTLHAVIDWSWHLLDPAAQEAMRALSVFPGTFSAAAARHLLGSEAVLEQLVEQSLLQVVASGTRFRMLETVREFSAARRPGWVVDGFLGWARDFAADWAESDLAAGPPAVAAIRAEQDNLLQALRYGLDRADGETVASTAALLGSLWITESNFTRLAGLAADTGWVLSHFRPGPAFVEATRTAAVFNALAGFVMPDLSPLRSLATLRRLPPAAPDTPIRAVQLALCAPNATALHRMADSAEPLPACVANYVLSYQWEHVNEPDRALSAARQMLVRLGDDQLLLRALAHGRIGELSLQNDPGEPAFRHLSAALELTTRLGWSTATRGRWALALADVQRGAYDEAERELAGADQGSPDDLTGLERFAIGARAQIALGRGDVEGGLRLWRQAAGLREPSGPGFWPFEVEAVTVIAHARHGRVDLVEDVVATLPGLLAATAPGIPVPEFPVCGTLLLALALTDIEHGATATGAGRIALAQRFGVLRGFQPDLSPARVRELAEKADRPAYEKAVASYAGLDHDGLRAAVSSDRA
ncbi:putative ATPase/DNA-binding SARP family transcriptional activator [Actinoplanes tereljensis]|uniref:ATP-binding protein n=1 Tax=Paractinoplanes tereljensis TaxID=571912 RepID=UPI001942D0CF|nr:BTAD domain-containing putative transcriptional regulator [Actinoplanes tereljensis]